MKSLSMQIPLQAQALSKADISTFGPKADGLDD